MWGWLKKIFFSEKVATEIKTNEFDFVALDFETANQNKSSICSCGLVAVKNGNIVEQKHFFICPKEPKFHFMNIKVHGIREKDVLDKPEFDKIWPEIQGYIDNGLVIAHNASFDIFALKAVLDLYNLDYPNINYLCTVALSKKVFPKMKNYKLNTLAEHFDIELNHHDALSDAVACANLAVKICNEHQVSSLIELTKKLNLNKSIKKFDAK